MLLDSREDFFAWDGLYEFGVYVLDALANLFFPFLTKIETIQARSDGFDQVRALARRQIERGLENLNCLSHSGSLALAGAWDIPCSTW